MSPHVRADRQYRPGQLRRGQAGHHRTFQIHHTGHAALQRALELPVALGVEPHDQLYPGDHAGTEADGREPAAHDAGQERAAGRVSGLGCCEGRHRAGVRRASTRSTCSARHAPSGSCTAPTAGRRRRSRSTPSRAVQAAFMPLDTSEQAFPGTRYEAADYPNNVRLTIVPEADGVAKRECPAPLAGVLGATSSYRIVLGRPAGMDGRESKQTFAAP